MQSTLILSKSDGSIIRSTGLLAEASVSSQTQENASFSDNSVNGNGSLRKDRGSNEGTSQDVSDSAIKGAESVARMVFSFVAGAQDFVRNMDGTDDMRLLRLRTRKNEIMIVPGG